MSENYRNARRSLTGDRRRFPDMWAPFIDEYLGHAGCPGTTVERALQAVCRLDEDLVTIVVARYFEIACGESMNAFMHVLDACVDEQDRRQNA